MHSCMTGRASALGCHVCNALAQSPDQSTAWTTSFFRWPQWQTTWPCAGVKLVYAWIVNIFEFFGSVFLAAAIDTFRSLPR
jgi:hypothetical protein